MLCSCTVFFFCERYPLHSIHTTDTKLLATTAPSDVNGLLRDLRFHRPWGWGAAHVTCSPNLHLTRVHSSIINTPHLSCGIVCFSYSGAVSPHAGRMQAIYRVRSFVCMLCGWFGTAFCLFYGANHWYLDGALLLCGRRCCFWINLNAIAISSQRRHRWHRNAVLAVMCLWFLNSLSLWWGLYAIDFGGKCSAPMTIRTVVRHTPIPSQWCRSISQSMSMRDWHCVCANALCIQFDCGTTDMLPAIMHTCVCFMYQYLNADREE